MLVNEFINDLLNKLLNSINDKKYKCKIDNIIVNPLKKKL